MSLIVSISGIRGTVGGRAGEALPPIDLVKFTTASAGQAAATVRGRTPSSVVGRDARISGEMVESLVTGTLMACGVDVIDAGMASTPTTEMAVIFSKADGGIILTASHNPKEWNALKLLNSKGEFLSDEEGQAIMHAAAKADFTWPGVDSIGTLTRKDFTDEHVKAVLDYPLVDRDAIRKAGFKVVLDAIN